MVVSGPVFARNRGLVEKLVEQLVDVGGLFEEVLVGVLTHADAGLLLVVFAEQTFVSGFAQGR